jgi:ADP-heptose:LPS heptosyltransferase
MAIPGGYAGNQAKLRNKSAPMILFNMGLKSQSKRYDFENYQALK